MAAGMEVRIRIQPDDIRPDDNVQVRISTYYRGMVFQREETLPHNMVTTVFDRVIFRARLEIKRLIQEYLEDLNLEESPDVS